MQNGGDDIQVKFNGVDVEFLLMIYILYGRLQPQPLFGRAKKISVNQINSEGVLFYLHLFSIIILMFYDTVMIY